MDHLPKPKPVTKGKVIPFPVSARSPFLPPITLPELPEPAPPPKLEVKARKKSRKAWALHAWLVLAWLVAMDRLQIALARGEVFDVRDALAFLVAVVMPIMRIRAGLEAYSRATRTNAYTLRKSDDDDVAKSA